MNNGNHRTGIGNHRNLARRIRSVVRRQGILFGGRKMRKLLMPAFVWLVTCVLLSVCAHAQTYGPFNGITYNKVGSCPTQTQGTAIGSPTVVVGFRIDGVSISGGTTTVSYSWQRYAGTGGNVNYGAINIWVDNSYDAGKDLNLGATTPGVWQSGTQTMTGSQVMKLRLYTILYSDAGQLNCTGPTSNYPGPAQDTVVASAGHLPQDLNWTYTNDKPYEVTLKLTKGGVDTGWTTTVGAAVNGVATTASGTITGLADATDYAILVQDPYDFTDGQWVDTGSLVTKSTTTVPNPTSGTPDKLVDHGTTPTNTSSTGNILGVPTPTNQPSQPPNSSTSGGTVWTPTTNTVDNERLDKATYRQGVDKITQNLDGIKDVLKNTTKTEPTLPADPADPAAVTLEVPTPETNFIPTAPTGFTGNFTSVSAVSANLTIPAMLGVSAIPVNWSYDFSTHSTIIGVLRDLLKFILVWCFFILCVKTARKACA